MKRACFLVLILFTIAHTGACFASALKRVNLALQWYPQAQFAGYYMALEKGIYAKHGLDVRIIPGSVDSSSCDKLSQWEADFATAFLSTALQQRSKGVPLVNIGQFVQRSAFMLITRKDSGIKSIQDMEGRRVGMWNNEFQQQALSLFKREGVNVKVIRQSPSFELFMRGGLDVVSAMWYNEYQYLISYGVRSDDMNVFFFSDLGFNMPEDGLYTLSSLAADSPEIASAMLKASTEGWEYAFSHPEETLSVILRIMKNANIRANKSHQKWMLARMQDIMILDHNAHIDTRLKQADFDKTQKQLISTGFIQSKTPYNEFYKGNLQ